MNLSDTLRGLGRRWYIVVPGLLLAIAVAVGAWLYVKPDYERRGTQLLLPGTASIPESSNPYLFLGGLSQASDVLVTAMSSDSVQASLLRTHPGAEIVVARDPTTSGPQLLTTVTARTNAEAREILTATLAKTEVQLGDLQDGDEITEGNRITIRTITVDDRSTLIQKTRILAVVGAALGMLLITLLLAGLVEGLATRRRRRATADSLIAVVDVAARPAEPEPLSEAPTAVPRKPARSSTSARSAPVTAALATEDSSGGPTPAEPVTPTTPPRARSARPVRVAAPKSAIASETTSEPEAAATPRSS